MSYQGWKNYETWNVALWLNNDQGSYTYWHEAAQEALDAADDHDAAGGDLSRRLKDEIGESMPDLGASMWADLLGAALSEVGWHEIAEHYLDDKTKADSEEA